MKTVMISLIAGLTKAKRNGLTFDALVMNVNLAPDFKIKLQGLWNSV